MLIIMALTVGVEPGLQLENAWWGKKILRGGGGRKYNKITIQKTLGGKIADRVASP